MTTVGRIYRFRAVHSLPGFSEPWCWPHQHDYTVEIVAKGNTDTAQLDAWWALWGVKDGTDMNARFEPSTVENIAQCLLDQTVGALAVTVWEDRQRWGRAER